MADRDIRIGVTTDTSDFVRELEEAETAAKQTGEAVDAIDDEPIDLDTGTAVSELEDVETGARNAASAADTAAGSLDKVTSSGGKTQGVMANLTGNAVQDLGAVAGVGGSAGVAIGQLAERASEGGIALRQMAGATAGIAGIGLAIEAVTGMLETMKAADAFDTAKVTAYKDAILEGVDAMKAMQLALTEQQGVSVREVGEAGLAGLLPWGDDDVIRDITDEVNSFGLSVGEFSDIASQGTERINEWGQAQLAAGQDAEKVQLVVLAMSQEYDKLAKGADAAAASQRFLNEEMTTGQLTAQTAAVNTLARAYRQLQQAMAAAANQPEPAGAPVGPMGTRTPTKPGGTSTTYNFFPGAPTPGQVRRAETEYRRVNGPN